MKNTKISGFILISFIFFFQIFNINDSFAQSTFKGVVTLQNSNKIPLHGVQIMALGSNPTTSDNQGAFQIVLKNKRPGDKVSINKIYKEGYEVVNKKDIENYLIPSKADHFAPIVMCPEGTIAENTAKYYDISLSALTKNYENRIKELQIQLENLQINAEAFNKQALELNNQFLTQQNNLEELAMKFALENFDDCSLLHKQAFEVFILGDIKEAIRILETVNSFEEIKKAIQQKEKGNVLIAQGEAIQQSADSIIAQNISKLLFQAELYKNNFQIDTALYLYKEIIKITPDNFDNHITYSQFLKDQSFFDEAITINQEAKNIAKNNYDSLFVFHELASCNLKINKLDSINYIINKIDLLNQVIFLNNPSGFITEYIINLGDLCNYYNKIGLPLLAEEKINEALKLIRENTFLNKKDYVSVYHLYSLFLHTQNRFKEAVLCSQKAIEIYRKNSKYSNTYDLSILSVELNNYANSLEKIGLYKDAKEAYNESETILANLAEKNPTAFNSFYSNTIENLAVLYYNENNYSKAIEYMEKAFIVNRNLSQFNPSAFNKDLVMSLINYALILENLNMIEQTEGMLNEALDLCKKMSIVNPHTFNPLLSTTYNNLSSFYVSSKPDLSKADSAIQNALTISRELVLINSEANIEDLARHLSNAGLIKTKLGRHKEAEDCFLEAIEIRRELSKGKLDFHLFNLFESLDAIATFYITTNNFQLAEKYILEATEIIKGLSISNPDFYKDDLARILFKTGKYYFAKKDYATSIQYYEKTLVILEELKLISPDPYRYFIANVYNILAHSQAKINLNEAINSAIESIDILTILINENQEVSKDLASCQSCLSYLYLLSNQFEKSLEASNNALSNDSTNLFAKKNIAHYQLFSGNFNDAFSIYSEIIQNEEIKTEILNNFTELEQAGITHPDIARIKEMIETKNEEQ